MEISKNNQLIDKYGKIYKDKCRICLKQAVEICELFRNGDAIPRKLMAVASVQVEEGDGLPPVICLPCNQRLDESYDFKCQIQSTDEKLRQILKLKASSNNSGSSASIVTAIIADVISSVISSEKENTEKQEECPTNFCFTKDDTSLCLNTARNLLSYKRETQSQLYGASEKKCFEDVNDCETLLEVELKQDSSVNQELSLYDKNEEHNEVDSSVERVSTVIKEELHLFHGQQVEHGKNNSYKVDVNNVKVSEDQRMLGETLQTDATLDDEDMPLISRITRLRCTQKENAKKLHESPTNFCFAEDDTSLYLNTDRNLLCYDRKTQSQLCGAREKRSSEDVDTLVKQELCLYDESKEHNEVNNSVEQDSIVRQEELHLFRGLLLALSKNNSLNVDVNDVEVSEDQRMLDETLQTDSTLDDEDVPLLSRITRILCTQKKNAEKTEERPTNFCSDNSCFTEDDTSLCMSTERNLLCCDRETQSQLCGAREKSSEGVHNSVKQELCLYDESKEQNEMPETTLETDVASMSIVSRLRSRSRSRSHQRSSSRRSPSRRSSSRLVNAGSSSNYKRTWESIELIRIGIQELQQLKKDIKNGYMHWPRGRRDGRRGRERGGKRKGSSNVYIFKN